MADSPQTVNQAAKTADTVLQTIFNIALPLAKAAEVAVLPFLGWPVISQLFDAVQDWIANKIRVAIATQNTYFIIDFETEEERSKFADAVIALQAAIAKGNLNDPALLQKAATLNAAFDRLVSSDGTYSTH